MTVYTSLDNIVHLNLIERIQRHDGTVHAFTTLDHNAVDSLVAEDLAEVYYLSPSFRIRLTEKGVDALDTWACVENRTVYERSD